MKSSYLLAINLIFVALIGNPFVGASEQAVPLRGQYAQIDTERELRAIKALTEGDDAIRQRWAEKIENHSDRFAPAVFFHLASYLFEQGEEEDALFWLYTGRIRTRFDIERCTDRSVVDAVEALSQQVPPLLRLIQFEDLDIAQELLEAAVEWDRTTEHNYDPRWIALHGLGAFKPAPTPGTEESLTVPEESWKKLAKRVRKDYAEHYFDFLDDLTDDQHEQIAAKISELRELQERN
jgi:hypothetical protein